VGLGEFTGDGGAKTAPSTTHLTQPV